MKKGFTLVELMIVAAILAIVAVVLVPALIKSMRREASETEVNKQVLATVLSEHGYMDVGINGCNALAQSDYGCPPKSEYACEFSATDRAGQSSHGLMACVFTLEDGVMLVRVGHWWVRHVKKE